MMGGHCRKLHGKWSVVTCYFQLYSIVTLASFPVSTPQLFFTRSKIGATRSKISTYFTTCEKSWGVETGNEAIVT